MLTPNAVSQAPQPGDVKHFFDAVDTDRAAPDCARSPRAGERSAEGAAAGVPASHLAPALARGHKMSAPNMKEMEAMYEARSASRQHRNNCKTRSTTSPMSTPTSVARSLEQVQCRRTLEVRLEPRS